MRNRSRARELALQILYQIDLRGDEIVEDLDSILASTGKSGRVVEFAREVITGVIARQEEIDARISDAAEHWHLMRMAVVDRNVMRLAVYEMLERDDIPPKVSINEAIELGKKYSTEQSGAFINGILDRIRIGLEAEAAGRQEG